MRSIINKGACPRMFRGWLYVPWVGGRCWEPFQGREAQPPVQQGGHRHRGERGGGGALQAQVLTGPGCGSLTCVRRQGCVREVGLCPGWGAGDFVTGGGTVERSWVGAEAAAACVTWKKRLAIVVVCADTRFRLRLERTPAWPCMSVSQAALSSFLRSPGFFIGNEI